MPRTTDIDACADQGETALYWAATSGNLATVRFLIKLGSDIDARAKNGLTPLGVALKHNHPEVVRLLKKHGAKE